jgi:hypothetical protein
MTFHSTYDPAGLMLTHDVMNHATLRLQGTMSINLHSNRCPTTCGE